MSRVLDRVEVHVSLMAILLHVFEELMEGKGMVRTSIDGATEVRIEPLMLVANVLSQVVFPKEGLLTTFRTTANECMLVLSCTRWLKWDSSRAWVDFVRRERAFGPTVAGARGIVVWSVWWEVYAWGVTPSRRIVKRRAGSDSDSMT
jgi:hypothetical protein